MPQDPHGNPGMHVKRRRCAAPGPALPAPGSGLGGPPGAPAPPHACWR
jgi:hypothetical protein